MKSDGDSLADMKITKQFEPFLRCFHNIKRVSKVTNGRPVYLEQNTHMWTTHQNREAIKSDAAHNPGGTKILLSRLH